MSTCTESLDFGDRVASHRGGDSGGATLGTLVLCFAAVYMFWGATYLAIRWAVADIPPLMMIGLRCAGGAVILFIWSAGRGELARPSRGMLRTAAVAGALMFAGCQGLLAWTEQRVASGTASLYLAAEPIWLVTLFSLYARRAPTRRVAGGLIMGVAGVALLSVGESGTEVGSPRDALALVVSGLAWALGSLVALHGSTPASALHAAALQLGAGALAILPLSVTLGEWSDWTPTEISGRAWTALAFLILGGTVLAFAAYTKLLRVASPAAAGSYAFVNPLVALGLAWAVGDQAFTARTLVAASLILLAVVLVMDGGAGSLSRSARQDG